MTPQEADRLIELLTQRIRGLDAAARSTYARRFLATKVHEGIADKMAQRPESVFDVLRDLFSSESKEVQAEVASYQLEDADVILAICAQMLKKGRINRKDIGLS